MLRRTRHALAAAVAALLLIPAAALADADVGLTVSPSAGTVRVGDTVNYTWTVTNLGPDAATGSHMDATFDPQRLQFATVIFVPPGASGVVSSAGTISINFPSPLASGSSSTLVLSFTALAPGNATIPSTLTTTTPDPVTANNTGSGPATLTWLEATPSPFEEPVGLVGPAAPVVVTNESNAPITLGAPVLKTDDWFLGTGDCSGATLAVDAACSMALRFAPQATGARSGVLTVPKTAGPGTPDHLDVQLTGNGTDGPVGPAGPTGPQGATGPSGSAGAAGPAGKPAAAALAAVTRSLKARAGSRLQLVYASTAAGKAQLDVLKGKRKVGSVKGAARFGRNAISWRARSKGRALAAGRYSYRLTLKTATQTAIATGTITLTKR